MASTQKLSYASALSSPPPKPSPRATNRASAVFSRPRRNSLSSRQPPTTAGPPHLKKVQVSLVHSPEALEESSYLHESIEAQKKGQSQLISPARSPLSPKPDHGFWEEVDAGTEVLKAPTKRLSRFSGFFASPDYRKRLEMAKRVTKLEGTFTEPPEPLSGISACQGEQEDLARMAQTDESAESPTEIADPLHYEYPTTSRQVAELVNTPAAFPASPLGFLSLDSSNESLGGGQNGEDALYPVGVLTRDSLLSRDHLPSTRRHSGSMSSADDYDDTYETTVDLRCSTQRICLS
ncbi:MAG: hypothetical protein M1839_007539 [Geoglossum umbratile]|nr:MAG: hypothetical protein M1839_007539 [Geoglossum umbratile]